MLLREDITDQEIEELEKLMVKLHNAERTDLYSLRSKWDPDGYKKTQGKQKIPASIRWKVWRRDNFICVYCYSDEATLTLDHVVPEGNGGEFSLDNLVTACNSCNNRKGDKPVREFMESEWLKNKTKQSLQRSSTMTPTQKQKFLAPIRARILLTSGTSS